MSADEFINQAIERGSRNGVASLDAVERMVFLISELETDCDMNGIDTFLSRYSSGWVSGTADAFEAVGAAAIADGLRAIKEHSTRDDALLKTVNELVTSRSGYDYDAIRSLVEKLKI
jgi:hypothetical protein